jgi:dienelactone hydrolase
LQGCRETIFDKVGGPAKIFLTIRDAFRREASAIARPGFANPQARRQRYGPTRHGRRDHIAIGRRAMKTEEIAYEVGGKRYVGYLALDEGRSGKRPGVLLAPEGPGRGPLVKTFARKLAEAGYVAFAMDYHGEGQVLTDFDEMMKRLGGFMADPAGIRAIASAALAVLVAQPETDAARLAAIGYCFGGTTALELARSGADLKCVVGFHSGLGTARPQDAKAIKARVLVQLGADDPLIPPAQRAAFEEEMRAGGVDYRILVYGGAEHSFTNPDATAIGRPGIKYDEKTDRRSWRAMLDAFDEAFA